MMRLVTLVIAGLCVVSLSGCKLTQVRGEVDGVKVEAKTKSGEQSTARSSGGTFCPPGQAKKGNC